MSWIKSILGKIGIRGPVYRLVGRGLSDRETANDLDITEVRVHDCIEWMQHFSALQDPNELAQGLHARLNIGQ